MSTATEIMREAAEGPRPPREYEGGRPVYEKKRPRTPQEHAAEVNEFCDRQQTQRYQLEKSWFIAISYFIGLHYFTWDDRARTIKAPPTPTYRVRLVANYILSTIETALAKLLKNKPILNCVPATDDETDVAGAKFSDRILDAYWRICEIPRKLHEVGKWMLVCGTTFGAVIWNGRAGATWSEPEQQPDGSSIQHRYYMGDVQFVSVPPFEILPEQEATGGGIRECRKLVHQRAMHVEEARAAYPESAHLINTDGGFDRSIRFDFRILTLGISGGEWAASGSAYENFVIVREMWERAESLAAGDREKYPGGRVRTVIGDKLVRIEANPYDHGDFPFVQFDAIPVPGRFWALGFVDLMQFLNRSYNRGRSRILEALAVMGAPKWLMSDQAGQGKRSITSEPGEIIRYREGTTPPQQIAPTNVIAPGHMESMKQDLQDIQEVTGLREVSRGSAPAGVTSGVAINLLQEQDDTRFGLVIARWEMSIEEIGQKILHVVRQFVTEPRLMKIAGEESEVEAVDFQGIDLGDNIDVRVTIGSGMPQSKIARQAMIFDMVKLGLLPQDNLPLIWSLLDMGGISKLYQKELVDIRTADTENRSMARGTRESVSEWEDHGTHITRHDLYRKSYAFKRLHPIIQQLFAAHVAEHRQYLAAQQAPPAGAPLQPQPGGGKFTAVTGNGGPAGPPQLTGAPATLPPEPAAQSGSPAQMATPPIGLAA